MIVWGCEGEVERGREATTSSIPQQLKVNYATKNYGIQNMNRGQHRGELYSTTATNPRSVLLKASLPYYY